MKRENPKFSNLIDLVNNEKTGDVVCILKTSLGFSGLTHSRNKVKRMMCEPCLQHGFFHY